LECAAQGGNDSIVQLLLDHNGLQHQHVPAAVSAAAVAGHAALAASMVRFLLDNNSAHAAAAMRVVDADSSAWQEFLKQWKGVKAEAAAAAEADVQAQRTTLQVLAVSAAASLKALEQQLANSSDSATG
jgi:hypothetical protein